MKNINLQLSIHLNKISIIVMGVTAICIPSTVLHLRAHGQSQPPGGMWTQFLRAKVSVQSNLGQMVPHSSSLVGAYSGASSIAFDSHHNLIITGATQGDLFGKNAGGSDCYIAKYSGDGTLIWGKQFGSSKNDFVPAAALDSHDNLYVVGHTRGSLFSTHVGDEDHTNIVIAKYDANGVRLWAEQFGAKDGGDDMAAAVCVDRQGKVDIAGSTDNSLFAPNPVKYNDPDAIGFQDMILMQYSADGRRLWSRQCGAKDNDVATSLATDSLSNIYVVGRTTQLFGKSLGASDAFIAKFSSGGSLFWGKQFGGPNTNWASSIAVNDAGNAYVIGHTDLTDNPATQDGFLAKFDTNGTYLWNKPISTPQIDTPEDVCLDRNGEVYVTGDTSGSLFQSNIGLTANSVEQTPSQDIFVAKYDPNGILLWGKQYGQGIEDMSYAVRVDNLNDGLYVAGATAPPGMVRSEQPNDDAFIQRMDLNGQMAQGKWHSSKFDKLATDAFGASKSKLVGASKDKHLTSKPVRFFWADRSTTLNYSPVLIKNKPYVYAGYLCYGISDASMIVSDKTHVIVTGSGRLVQFSSNASAYQINGKEYKFTEKPTIIDGNFYVPLAVFAKVLPLTVRYDTVSKAIHFDPVRMALR